MFSREILATEGKNMTATVEIFGLSGEEMAQVGRSAAEKARAKLFAQGLPVVWVRNGVRVRDRFLVDIKRALLDDSR